MTDMDDTSEHFGGGPQSEYLVSKVIENAELADHVFSYLPIVDVLETESKSSCNSWRLLIMEAAVVN